MDLFRKNLALLSDKLDVYDVILGKQKYLAGDVSLVQHLQLVLITDGHVFDCLGGYPC